jgi:hypothetical protein
MGEEGLAVARAGGGDRRCRHCVYLYPRTACIALGRPSGRERGVVPPSQRLRCLLLEQWCLQGMPRPPPLLCIYQENRRSSQQAAAAAGTSTGLGTGAGARVHGGELRASGAVWASSVSGAVWALSCCIARATEQHLLCVQAPATCNDFTIPSCGLLHNPPDVSPNKKRPPWSRFDVLVQTVSCFGCVTGTGSVSRERVFIHLRTSNTSSD